MLVNAGMQVVPDKWEVVKFKFKVIKTRMFRTIALVKMRIMIKPRLSQPVDYFQYFPEAFPGLGVC